VDQLYETNENVYVRCCYVVGDRKYPSPCACEAVPSSVSNPFARVTVTVHLNAQAAHLMTK
jgi:hypothetical protein